MIPSPPKENVGIPKVVSPWVTRADPKEGCGKVWPNLFFQRAEDSPPQHPCCSPSRGSSYQTMTCFSRTLHQVLVRGDIRPLWSSRLLLLENQFSADRRRCPEEERDGGENTWLGRMKNTVFRPPPSLSPCGDSYGLRSLWNLVIVQANNRKKDPRLTKSRLNLATSNCVQKGQSRDGCLVFGRGIINPVFAG